MTGNHHPRRRSNAELDVLIDGQGDGTPLAGLVNELRDLGMTSSTVPNESLTEFVSAPHRAPVDGTPQTLRRKPMITSLVATLGTTAGKVLVGSVAAAAVVTGAIAADVSNPSEPIEVAAVQTTSSSSTPSTAPTSTSIATSTTTDGSSSSVTTATTTPDRSTSTETTTTTTVVGRCR